MNVRRILRKAHLWLIAHGVEFEADRSDGHLRPLTISIALNHRYVGVELGVRRFRGVYTDELNTPHAEIAAGIRAHDHE